MFREKCLPLMVETQCEEPLLFDAEGFWKIADLLNHLPQKSLQIYGGAGILRAEDMEMGLPSS